MTLLGLINSICNANETLNFTIYDHMFDNIVVCNTFKEIPQYLLNVTVKWFEFDCQNMCVTVRLDDYVVTLKQFYFNNNLIQNNAIFSIRIYRTKDVFYFRDYSVIPKFFYICISKIL